MITEALGVEPGWRPGSLIHGLVLRLHHCWPVRDLDLMRDFCIWRAGDVFPASARSNSTFMLTKTDCLWPVKETFVCQLTYNEIRVLITILQHMKAVTCEKNELCSM